MRLATQADVNDFYEGNPPAFSMRAMVGLLDGAPVALGGIVYRKGVIQAFMELKHEIRQHKFFVARFAYSLRRFGKGVPGVTIAQPGEATAPRLLEWLGFEYAGSCDDGEVYVWLG